MVDDVWAWKGCRRSDVLHLKRSKYMPRIVGVSYRLVCRDASLSVGLLKVPVPSIKEKLRLRLNAVFGMET